jgi:lactoylglutathione lyase
MVDHLDEAMQTLSSKGVKFITGAVERPEWGMRTAHFRDPDGYLLELGEQIPMSE